MKRNSILMLGLALAAGPVMAIACGGNEPEPATAANTTATPTPEPTPEPTPTPAASPEPTTPPEPPKPAAVVEDMTPSPDPTPLPTVKILAPAMESALTDLAKAKDATVRLEVHGWDRNSPPERVRERDLVVASGAEVTARILEDWTDPDGDDLVLVAASAATRGEHETSPRTAL